jgi:hypothetical protein
MEFKEPELHPMRLPQSKRRTIASSMRAKATTSNALIAISMRQ